MTDVYRDSCHELMAMPAIRGTKSANERFPGAVDTQTIEVMMQDGKALQCGTSHDLGQNFAKVSNIMFQNMDGEREYVWQTSWGASTRLVGAVIMSHSDDDGLVLPPRLAPIHVAIVPIYRKDDERSAVLEAAGKVAEELRADGLSVRVDDREGMNPGAKYYDWERKGVPLRLEIGPRDLESRSVMSKLRIAEMNEKGRPVKEQIPLEGIGVRVGEILDGFQGFLFDRALARQVENTRTVDAWDDFTANFESGGSGFVWAHWDGTTETELAIKEATKATLRCIALPGEGPDPEPGACIKTGKPSAQRVLFAKAY